MGSIIHPVQSCRLFIRFSANVLTFAAHQTNMKKILLTLSISALLISCGNPPKQDEATAETQTDSTVSTGAFGSKIDEAGAISMDSLMLAIQAGKGAVENVKVQGLIEGACQKKGCWMNMDGGNGTSMRVTFKDYAFFVPKNCGGKTAIIQGRAYLDTTSVQDLRHYAEDAGVSQDSLNKITEPEIELAFEAEGVIIK